MTRPDVDVVIVATTNDVLAEVTAAALAAGKHVLVEKPAGRHVSEIEPLMAAAAAKKLCVRVASIIAYHPALQRAKAIVDSGGSGR